MSFAKHSLFHPNKLGLAIFLCMSAAQSFAAGNIRLDLSANSSRSVGEVDVKLVPREGEPLSYQTDEQGRLLIKGLDAGLYELQIQKQGYLSLRLPSVRVIDDKTTPLKQKLSPVKGQLEEVLVIGNASSGDVLGAVSSFEVSPCVATGRATTLYWWTAFPLRMLCTFQTHLAIVKRSKVGAVTLFLPPILLVKSNTSPVDGSQNMVV